MLPRKEQKKTTLYGIQTLLAKKHRLSRKHVCQLINGRVEATTPIARALLRDYQKALATVARNAF